MNVGVQYRNMCMNYRNLGMKYRNLGTKYRNLGLTSAEMHDDTWKVSRIWHSVYV